MKRKPDDWADKTAAKFVTATALNGFTRGMISDLIRSVDRAAEKRGFRRAVKLLREEPDVWDRTDSAYSAADWLEEQERK